MFAVKVIPRADGVEGAGMFIVKVIQRADSLTFSHILHPLFLYICVQLSVIDELNFISDNLALCKQD